MAGELFLQQFETGKESTAGTEVVSTRLMYWDESSKLSRTREARPHKFATGTRQSVRSFSLGPQKVAGTASLPLSSAEIIELLLIGLQGGVTPTPVGASYLWTFTPGASLDAATVRWHDGARPWRAAGVRADKLKIAGSVDKENTLTADLFAQSLIQQALTGSLTARVPDVIEGWESKLYIDAFGGTPGSSVVSGTLLNWEVEIDNGLAYKFFADNVNAAGAVVASEVKISAKLTFEAAPATALTEFNNWDAATKRLVRLEFGNNVVLETTHKAFVTVDLAGAWDAFDLGQSDNGTRAYQLGAQYVFDPTNTFGLQVRCQNARAAAWA